MSDTRRISVHGVCPHDCYDTCGMGIEWKDGQIYRIQGQMDPPITQGFLCFKVNRYLERVNHPDRVLHPLKRTGAKGAGQFERVTWDDALRNIAVRLGHVINRFGGDAILPYSFAGNMGVLSEAVPMPPLNPNSCIPVPAPSDPSATGPDDIAAKAWKNASIGKAGPRLSFKYPS